jgi:hypothetical protein
MRKRIRVRRQLLRSVLVHEYTFHSIAGAWFCGRLKKRVERLMHPRIGGGGRIKGHTVFVVGGKDGKLMEESWEDREPSEEDS